MLVGSDELQVMPGIGFMRAGEGNAKMLLLLGEFIRRTRLDHAEIVHPKNAALTLFERPWLVVSGRRYYGAQKFRDKLDLQFVPLRKGNGTCPSKTDGNPT